MSDSNKFLNYEGVQKLWTKTKAHVSDQVKNKADTNVATQSIKGLMSAEDKQKLDNIEAGANIYKHPEFTPASKGLYKITVNSEGHVSSTTAVTKSDITALGIPAQDENTAHLHTAGNGIELDDPAASSTLWFGGTGGTTEISAKIGPGLEFNSSGAIVPKTSGTFVISGQKYPVSVDSSTERMYVHVPWTDTNLALTVEDKNETIYKDTKDYVFAITNLTEGGQKGHTLTPEYTGLPTIGYVNAVADEIKKMITGSVSYLGTVSDLSGLSTTAEKGDFYRVSEEFAYGSFGEKAHVGDILIAIKDNPTRSAADWDLIHTEIDKNTWEQNSKTADGYVLKGNGYANMVWKTDSDGNPAWRSDANNDTKVTSALNHYDPSNDEGNIWDDYEFSPNTFIKSIFVERDYRGHVTHIECTEGAFPTTVESATTAETAIQAEKLKTPHTFSLSGDATSNGVSFDGTSNIVIPVTINAITSTELDAILV